MREAVVNCLDELPTNEVDAAYMTSFEDLSDIEILDACSRVICRPRSNPDSFSLHAPLELLARFLLMSRAPSSVRQSVRTSMLKVATRYREGGDWLDDGALRPVPGGVDRQALRTAIDRGDVEAADALAAAASRELDDVSLRRWLGFLFDTSLAGAGHGPILLNLIGRVCAGGARQAQCLLRNFVRALATDPEQRIHWFGDVAARVGTLDSTSLDAAVSAAVSGTTLLTQEPPGGIQNLVRDAESKGEIQRRLDFFPTVDWREPHARDSVGNALCRMAAIGMLVEPEKHAKYGWTHCLTLPQAAYMAASYNDDPSRAMALAGSFVVGLRHGLASKPWPAEPPPAGAGGTLDALAHALGDGPEAAVAAALELPAEARGRAHRLLAREASLRTDAHLVKYTLACFDAAVSDQRYEHIYLAASARLNAIWIRDEPLTGPPMKARIST